MHDSYASHCPALFLFLANMNMNMVNYVPFQAVAQALHINVCYCTTKMYYNAYAMLVPALQLVTVVTNLRHLQVVPAGTTLLLAA